MKKALIISSLLMLFFVTAVNASPKSDYMIHCMGCHKLDGQGLPPQVPAFDSSLGDIVGKAGGRAYLIQVPGASQSPLNNKKLAAVLSWLLKEFVTDSLPENFADIRTGEVDQHRATVLKNPAIVREKLLAQ